MIPPDLVAYPDQPGIYLYKDGRGRIIYVGKARSIRKRLASYFAHGPKHPKTLAMLREAVSIDTVVANTESEALALENAFIKKHKPRYNVLLRDDKTFPYIKVTTGEEWPRALVTRRLQKDGHSYYGPFLPARTCRGAMKIVTRLFQIRTCRIEIDGKLPRPCLYYDMHACLAPCVSGLTSKAAYGEAVQDVLLFLEGKNVELRARIEKKMLDAAEAENFEMAAAYRDCLKTIDELTQKQDVQRLSGEDVDVFGEFADEGNLSVSLLIVRGGTVLDTREFHWEGLGDVEGAEFWPSLLSQYYDSTTFLPREIHIPWEGEGEVLDPIENWLTERRGARVQIRTPQRGSNLERVRIARDNARENHTRRFKKVREAGEKATVALARALDMERRPAHLECFDISHHQGAQTYASCVVFLNGEPDRSRYRLFKIDREEPDDFASIADAVTRRLRGLLDEKESLPDLLLIDGGKGQLHAALGALDRMGLSIPAAGLAKREELVFVPGRSAPLTLSRRDPALKLLQRARDEAHRFGIKHHRKAARAQFLKSPLLDIPGVGPKNAKKLLEAFGGAGEVLAADETQLSAVVGPALASRLREHAETGKRLRESKA